MEDMGRKMPRASLAEKPWSGRAAQTRYAGAKKI
jgi:hypothetical protein